MNCMVFRNTLPLHRYLRARLTILKLKLAKINFHLLALWDWNC